MEQLTLHDFHAALGARFGVLNGTEVVEDYGDWLGEYTALGQAAGVVDLSSRSRLCLTGADRVRFLHGQVTNDIKRLGTGHGCYAALATAKGRMQSDLNVYALADELLLDFEPGLSATIAERLNKYIVADDVQVVDVAPHYGLLTIQGARAAEAVERLELFASLPGQQFDIVKASDATLGEIYLARQPRFGTDGFDVFVPMAAVGAVADKLIAAAKAVGGRASGWRACEVARIEAGIPRFGVDMDETNLPQECGIEARAMSYTKGCYIGQEVLNRVHTMGHVNRSLRGLYLPGFLKTPPEKGAKLFHEGKEVGFITSAVHSPRWGKNIGLGYVRREVGEGTTLTLTSANIEGTVGICPLPFRFVSK